MNIIQFKKGKQKKLVFCLVDRLAFSQDNFTKEIIKNQSDYSISNLYEKFYDVYQGFDEDELLKAVSDDGYEYAVVFSTGTEFVNGNNFFKKAEELLTQDFFICGHVLDRKDAYYELHHQCYIINLKTFQQLDMPKVGNLELGLTHTEYEPTRSNENYHDDYTPLWVKTGSDLKKYNHKCHGWNILKIAFEKQLSVLIFDNKFRNSKQHHYPENRIDFLKNLSWIYGRNQECATTFVHTDNTEKNMSLSHHERFDQIIIPASGTLYHDLIDSGSVIVYDYNEKSLEYWKEYFPKKQGVTYSFIKVDLLGNNNLVDHVLSTGRVLVNLSNIFCYEGTSALTPLYYRVYKENELINNLQNKNSNITITFSMRAATGFVDTPDESNPRNVTLTNLESLKRPTWHYNEDWK